MAAALVLTLAALLALQPGLKRNEVVDVETTEHMKQQEAFLNEQMTQLLEEVEQRQGTEEATLPSVLEQWQFWRIPAVLLLFSAAYWLDREMVFPSACHSDKESSSSKQEKGEEEEINGFPNGAQYFSMSTPSTAQGLPNKCKVVKELVHRLLSVCRVLAESNFMPQLYTATRMDDTCESWAIEENSIAYHLLVFLRPPPGHSFSLDQHTTKQLPGRPTNIHVGLECMCWKELLGGCVCFLHHHDNKGPRVPRSCLLENLCTSSYLDMEKVARWVRVLVTSAWQFFPESHHCQLTVLPSSKSCKFQLTSTAEINILSEIFFAVDHEN